MRTWNLKSGDPLSLELACDARIVHPDYSNDHIWEVHLSGGEPPALSVETTYGLRARQMRLYPRFEENGEWKDNPEEFERPPAVSQIFPNYLRLQFSPFQDIDAVIEYWVPESHAIAGRVHLKNTSGSPRKIGLEWVAVLLPVARGEGMSVWQQVVSPVLKGQAEDLWPVFFTTGGPGVGNSPFASLIQMSELNPDEERITTWGLAAARDAAASFELARQVTARTWEAEKARIELVDEGGSIEITSLRPDWDAIFAFSQKVARSLVMGPEPALPALSFVASRRPDQGYSPRGDGSDYQHLWNGQTALSAHYLCTQALPNDLALRQGILENFAAATRGGKIDFKPGLAGQRGRLPVQPYLCQLAAACLEQGASPAWVRRLYPQLLQSVKDWFEPADSLPHWYHLQQMGFDDHPIYNRTEGAAGVDITTTEDPVLFSLLLMELEALIGLSNAAGITEDQSWLGEKMSSLQLALQNCWNETRGAFMPRDCQTQVSGSGSAVARFFGSGSVNLDSLETLPSRLLIHILAATENTRSPRVHLRGTWKGKPVEEEITARSVFWLHNQAWITTLHVYDRVDEIDVRGLDPRDEVVVRTPDLTTSSLASFLPLITGLCSPAQASRIIQEHLTNPGEYCLPFGMPSRPPDNQDSASPTRVCLPWNVSMIAAIFRGGFHEEAAVLFEHLMDGIRAGLKVDHHFRANFNARNGLSGGDASVVEGLAPLKLFLELSGIKIITPRKILLSETNCLPGPITVKYQGMKLVRDPQGTVVTFPDGQQVQASAQGEQLISITEL